MISQGAKDCTDRCARPVSVPKNPSMPRLLFLLPLMLLFTHCGAGDPSFVRLGDYECDAGEAVVRHIIKTMPDPAPGLPKEYTIVKALDLRAADMDFIRRFSDLGLPIISAEVLSEQEETHFPINPKSGLSPIMIHLQRMKRPNADTYEVDAGWAHKRTFDQRSYRVRKSGDKWTVEEVAKLGGNAVP